MVTATTGTVDKLLTCAAYSLTILLVEGSPLPNQAVYEEAPGQDGTGGFFVDEDGWLVQDEGGGVAYDADPDDFTGDGNAAGTVADREPPFAGTSYLADIIQDSDPTMFSDLIPRGRVDKAAILQRLPAKVALYNDPHLFVAVYLDDMTIEFVVDGSLGEENTIAGLAEAHAAEFGKLPRMVRRGVRTAVITNNKMGYFADTESGTVVMGNTDTQLLKQGGWWGGGSVSRGRSCLA